MGWIPSRFVSGSELIILEAIDLIPCQLVSLAQVMPAWARPRPVPSSVVHWELSAKGREVLQRPAQGPHWRRRGGTQAWHSLLPPEWTWNFLPSAILSQKEENLAAFLAKVGTIPDIKVKVPNKSDTCHFLV